MESALVWLWHACALAYSWPLICRWWHGDAGRGYEHGVPLGRSRAAVVASLMLPLISWVWLLPMAHDFRRQQRQQHQLARADMEREQHAADVAYWTRQLRCGDPLAEQVAQQLLEMWGVEIKEWEHLDRQVRMRMTRLDTHKRYG